jgi:hypothetical protein
MTLSAARIVAFSFLLLSTIASVFVYRTFVVFRAPEAEPECKPSASHKPITDIDNLVARFSRAIQFRTVTRGVLQVNEVELLRFIDWLQSGKSFW